MKFLMLFILTGLSCSNAKALNVFFRGMLPKDTNEMTRFFNIQTSNVSKVDKIRIDSICEVYDNILKKMPVPVFKLAQRNPDGLKSNDGVPMTYDSINSILSTRGYESKIGPDTLDNIVRSIQFNPHAPEYSSVTYSDLKTKKILIKVVTGLNGEDVSIYYYAKKLIRISEIDYYTSQKIGGILYKDQMNCYFKNRFLALAEIKGNKHVENVIDEKKTITISCGTGTIFLIYRKLPKSIYKLLS